MSSTDQKTTKQQPTTENSNPNIDESFQQDHLDSFQSTDTVGTKSTKPAALFSKRLADAFDQESTWLKDPNQGNPSTKNDENNTEILQIEWALALANSLMGLGIDLGLNNEKSPPQMSPREIAIKLKMAVQHPDRELRNAAISVIQAMNIPLQDVLSSDGVDTICSHLSSL
jgi:hypothetical protein